MISPTKVEFSAGAGNELLAETDLSRGGEIRDRLAAEVRALKMALKARRKQNRPVLGPIPLYVAAHPATSVSRLRAALAYVPDYWRGQLRLLFRVPRLAKPLYDPTTSKSAWVRKRYARYASLDRGKQAEMLSEGWKPAFGACKAIMKDFGAAGAHVPFLWRAALQTSRDCGCKGVSLDRLEYQFAMAIRHPLFGYAPLSQKTLQSTAAKTVESLVKQL
jgi:hypothetical protein